MAGRYFGGQYDSVKQAAYYDYLKKAEKHRGKLRYQVLLDNYLTRLRLDILLGGQAVITDAMFFDGLFFQSVFLHKEQRDDFTNFLRLLTLGSDVPLIEIRQREKTISDTLLSMLCRPQKNTAFVMSSLASKYVRDEVAKLFVKTQNEQEFNQWDQFLLKVAEKAEDETIRDKVLEKLDVLKYMSNIPRGVCVEWEKDEDGKIKRPRFKETFDEARSKNRFNEQRTGDRVIDSILALIEEESRKEFPNRSLIHQEIEQKTEIFSRPPLNMQEKALELVWGQFLQVYNRAIGEQHDCDTFDVGEILLADVEAGDELTEALSQATLQAITNDSWTEFGKKFNNLSRERNEWLEAVWMSQQGFDISRKDLMKSLEQYVKAMLRIYNVRPSLEKAVALIGGGASVDVDLMDANGLSLGVGATLIKIPVEVMSVARKTFVYLKDKNNLVEYGARFIQRWRK